MDTIVSFPAPASPVAFWRRAHPRARHGFVLGSGAGTPNDRVVYLSLAEPTRVHRAAPSAVPALLHRLCAQYNPRDAYPRHVGFLGFDAGRGFDDGIGRLPRRRDPVGLPAALFGDYPAVARIDVTDGRMDVLIRGGGTLADRVCGRIEAALGATDRKPARRRGRKAPVRVASGKTFAAMVARAKERIAAGDIYQANLSLRFDRRFDADPCDLYAELCHRNPSPYAALIKADDAWIVSCSPELLVDCRGHWVTTRPIAGTRPRGSNRAADRRTSGRLLLSPKERAEHIMLVDLERNDLGRVCKNGSVKVTETMSIERYSHVMHIVSEVRGRLQDGRRPSDVLAATFPGGTITGCPKIRSIELIEDIEKESRSIFYGSAGYFTPSGDAKFNILIRTALIRRGRLTLRAGAGIVADSRANREYHEVFAKAKAVLEAADRVS